MFQQLLTNTNADGQTGQNFNLDPYTNPTQQASAAGYPLLTADRHRTCRSSRTTSARVFITNKQENYTQEAAPQSSDPAARFNWVAGIFFQTRQAGQHRGDQRSRSCRTLVPLLFGGDFSRSPRASRCSPTATVHQLHHRQGPPDRAFGDATFAITAGLKITAGARYAWTKYSFNNFSDGPQNIGFKSGSGGKSETPFTPKAGIDFQATRDDLYYFTFAKGFRIGGANPPIPLSLCAADIDKLGAVPSTYNSDNVYSYEVGSKNKFFGRRCPSPVAPIISNGQHPAGELSHHLRLPVHRQFRQRAKPGLRCADHWAPSRPPSDLAVGYTSARYSKPTVRSARQSQPLSSPGDTVPGVRPWTVAAATARYSLHDNDAFVRGDFSIAAATPAPTPRTTRRTRSMI